MSDRTVSGLPPALGLAEAARLLGIGASTAYAEAARTYDPAARRAWLGPVPVLRIGRRWVVPTAPLLRALGDDDAAPGGGAGAASHEEKDVHDVRTV